MCKTDIDWNKSLAVKSFIEHIELADIIHKKP